MAEPTPKFVSSPYARVGARLVDMGYSAVPCMPGTKIPGQRTGEAWSGMATWSRYSDRLPTEYETPIWSRWPDAGVCVVLDHVVKVVDVDTDDEEIRAALADVIPDSPVKKRGQKGYSAFFRGSERVTNQAFNVRVRDKAVRVVDLLAYGRQTVIPPTIHPDTGSPYSWLGEALEGYAPGDLPELPDDIADRIADALAPFGYEEPEERYGLLGVEPGDSVFTDVKKAAYNNLARWVPALGLPRCERSGQGYRAVAAFRPSGSGKPLDKRNLHLSIHPDGIVDWGDNDRRLSPIDLVMVWMGYDLGTAVDWLRERLEYKPPAIDVTRMIARAKEKAGRHFPQDAGVVGMAANDNEQDAAPPRPRFEVTWFSEIEEGAPKEHVIDGVLGVGEFTVIVGKPGTGKSVIATDMAGHVAAGLPWHGRTVRQGLVVYFAAERKKLTERRLRAFRIRHALGAIPLAVVGGKLDMTGGLRDAQDLVRLIKTLEDQAGHTCTWIVVDTLSRTFGGGDQNASKDMGRFVQAADELMRGTGAHVTVIHHSPWNEDRGKGAIDLDGAVDASFVVSRTGAVFSLRCDGTNDGEDGPVTHFRLESVDVAHAEDGTITSAPVVVQAEPGNTLKDRAPGDLSPSQRQALAALRTACADSGQSSQGFGYPPNTSLATEAQWRDAYDAANPDDSRRPESRDRMFRRARGDLVGRGLVETQGQWFWPAAA